MSVTTTAPQSNTWLVPDVIGLGGAVAGLFGGLATIVVGAILSVMHGDDIWLQSEQIAAVVLGASAVSQVGFALVPVVVGTLLHLVTSMLLGAFFGIIKRRVLKLPSDLGMPIWAGMVYGLLTWIIAFFIVLPLANPLLLDTYAPSFVIQHIVYGIVTGVLYAYIRPAPYYTMTNSAA